MIDEVEATVPDSLERWKNEADARTRRSKARRRERRETEAQRLLPHDLRLLAEAFAIVAVVLVLLALLAVAVGAP